MQKIFLLGNARSGTSLLRIMLNNHPSIVATPECGFLHWWYNKYKDWKPEYSSSIQQINRFVNDLVVSRKFETWKLDKDIISETIFNVQPQNYEELGALIYVIWANKKGKNPSVIIDKNNYYINHLDDLPKIWESAKYIHLIRDGRDVACSYLDIKELKTDSPYKPILPTKIDKIAAEWVKNNFKVKEFISKKNNQHIIVRYEELVFNSKKTLSKITNFLKLSYSDNMMNYYQNNEEPESTLDWKKETLNPPDRKKIGRYKNYLSKQEIEKFNSIASSTLEYYGYE